MLEITVPSPEEMEKLLKLLPRFQALPNIKIFTELLENGSIVFGEDGFYHSKDWHYIRQVSYINGMFEMYAGLVDDFDATIAKHHGAMIGRDTFLKQLKARHAQEISELKAEIERLQK